MDHGESVEDLLDVLLATGVPVSASADDADLVIDPNGPRLSVDLKRRSLVDELVAKRLLHDQRVDMTLVVVADRVTATARELLLEGGAGYLDLRGHLAVRSGGVYINSDFAPIRRESVAPDPLTGRAGKEVAAALLTHPDRTFSVRGLAADLGRSPSTISTVLKRLRAHGSVDERNTLVDPSTLFWQLAERWSSARTYLHQIPSPSSPALLKPLRLGIANAEDRGWALSSDIAAAVYGAPVAVAGGQRQEFYVPDRSIIRRATMLLRETTSAVDARCSVRVAPVAAVCSHRIDANHNPTPWPLARPLFVALDLAQDAGRGREILQSWTPEAPWHRVW